MRLVPLFDKTGTPSYWADPQSCQVFDSTGQGVALIKFDGVFDQFGQQIGWWYGDHIRDLFGRLLLFLRGAQIPGLNLPSPGSHLGRPGACRLLPQVTLRRIEHRPEKKPQWSPLPLSHAGLQRLSSFLERYGSIPTHAARLISSE
jgi:hypothetical protein